MNRGPEQLTLKWKGHRARYLLETLKTTSNISSEYQGRHADGPHFMWRHNHSASWWRLVAWCQGFRNAINEHLWTYRHRCYCQIHIGEVFVSWTVHAMEPFSSSSDVADEVNANNRNVEYFILIYFVLYLFMQSNTFCVRTTLRPGHDVGICFTSCYFNKWTDKRLNKWVCGQIRPNTCIRQYIVSFEWTVHIIPLLNFAVNYKDRTTS